jgi:hypothetical protein
MENSTGPDCEGSAEIRESESEGCGQAVRFIIVSNRAASTCADVRYTLACGASSSRKKRNVDETDTDAWLS